MAKTTLLIAGASVRAAIGSADKSGEYQLLAADLFNDHDLRRACRSWLVDSRYATLAKLVARERPDFWMYTGALENHPQVIAEVSRHARLLGNDEAIVRQMRQPSQFAAALAIDNLTCPEHRTTVCPSDGNWLRKPYRSAAGIGIRPAVPGETNDASDAYYQRLISGTPCSAVYVAQRGVAQMLGVTRQLSGESSLGATGFQYCGSIGPLPQTETAREQWERVGNCLASSFEIQGLFGVDAIVRNGQVVPIEINPRYTASIEILEAGQSWSSIDLHFAACLDERVVCPSRQPSSTYYGKAIVFAQQKTRMTDELIAWIDHVNDSSDGPHIADIPPANLAIAIAQPVLTVFARSDTSDGVLPQLQQRAASVMAKLNEAKA